jgi:c-di-GMP-binding flagellar brake protein YcgR
VARPQFYHFLKKTLILALEFVTIGLAMYDVKIKITRSRQKKKTESPPEKQNSDRRRHPRVEFIREASYQLSKSPAYDVFTQDISQTGMCLLLDNEVSPGMILKLNFDLPGQSTQPIDTLAEVIWQDNYLTGVKFISSPPESTM